MSKGSTSKLIKSPLGIDSNGTALIHILREKGNVAIGNTRYKKIISRVKKEYSVKTEEEALKIFLGELYCFTGFNVACRRAKDDHKQDDVFYILEEDRAK